MPKTRQLLLLGVGGVALALFCAGSAHADQMLIPGYTDGECVGYRAQLDAAGQYAGGQCASYPAEIAPMPGSTLTFDQATDIAAQHAYDIYNAGGIDSVRSFSEGGGGALKFLDRLAAEGRPLPLNVMDGPAYGSTSFLGGPVVGIVEPVVNAFGIPTDLEVPAGSVRNYSANDIWANGGGRQNPAGLIAQASVIQTDHSVQPSGDPHITFTDEGGVVNNVYDVGTIPVVDPNLPLPELPAVPVDLVP